MSSSQFRCDWTSRAYSFYWLPFPIGSMGLVYLPTFTINLGKYTVRPMDPMGFCKEKTIHQKLNGTEPIPTDPGVG